MAASGYTPILIYASGTASNVPTAGNLTSTANGAELALNYADGILYFKNSSGVVTALATATAAAGAFPTGTAVLFQQTAAPTGWTKVTTYNNYALRVTSGSVTTGGSVAFTTAFNAANTVDGTAISTAQMPSHNHGITDPGHNHSVNDPTHNHTLNDPGHSHSTNDPSHNHNYLAATVAVAGSDTNAVAGGNSQTTTNSYTGLSINGAGTGTYNSAAATGISNNANTTGISTNNNGSGATHTHTLTNLAVQYVDIIIATKN